MDKKALVMSPLKYREVIECLKVNQKIRAMKLTRDATGVGLREAKEAVDRLSYKQKGVPIPSHLSQSPLIVANPRLVKIILDYGTGPIELDLEEMELRALMELPVIGLDACAHMLELVEIFQALSEGKKLKIVEDFEEAEIED